MLNNRQIHLILCFFMISIPFLNFATKYAGEIFYSQTGVENQAMGNTGVTNENSSALVWWNPALLSLPTGNAIEFMHAEQFDGMLQLNHFSAVWGKEHRLGLVITHLGIDDIVLTRLENPALPISNSNRPIIWKTTANNDFMMFFGISRKVKDDLHLGVTPKLAYRNLIDHNGYGFGADLGMVWEITPTLRFGNVLKDFFTTQILWENGTYENILPSLHSELGYRFTVLNKDVPVYLALGMETLSEGREKAATISLSPISLDFHCGLAVLPIPELKLMAGYDIDTFTTGIGLNIKQFTLSYAYKLNPNKGLGTSHRIAVGWRW